MRFFAKKTVADGERFNLRTHETSESVLGSANNRLPTNVKACVHDDWAAGLFLKSSSLLAQPKI